MLLYKKTALVDLPGTLVTTKSSRFSGGNKQYFLFYAALRLGKRFVILHHIPVGGYWAGRRKSPAVAIADTRTEVPSIFAIFPVRADTSAPVIAPDILAFICHNKKKERELQNIKHTQKVGLLILAKTFSIIALT